MSEKISRRDFLKLTGVGAAVSAVLTGCGPMSRYIVRKPYTQMPEYNQTGLNTYYASTCRECPAGCGIIVRTKEGRAITIEGNPNHPVNHGKLCARGLTAQQGLYNPDRIHGPVKQARGGGSVTPISWDDGIAAVSSALSDSAGTAFLMGLAPDHLYLLVKEWAEAAGAPEPVRYSALASFEGRNTLVEAVRRTFGAPALPFFDLGQSDVVFSFGANFLETWLSPVAYSQAYGAMRRGNPTRRGYLVVFEPRGSVTSGSADEWIPIRPGSESIVALALSRIVAETRGAPVPSAASTVTVSAASQASGISIEKLEHLGKLFAGAAQPLAIPGGAAIAQDGGLATAQAVLQMNILAGNIDQPGGVYLSTAPLSHSGLDAVKALIQRMNNGEVKTLLIHNINPVFELPGALGFAEALAKVPQVISFATFPDETALQSDLILPDHSALESFGFQETLAGSDRPALSAYQPVVAPLYDTRATADVLIAASGLGYTDEVDFIQQKIVPLIGAGGFYTAPEIQTFWTQWLQYGGWWKTGREMAETNGAAILEGAIPAPEYQAPVEDKEFYLVVYPNHFGDGSGANRPWLQEMPDPMTTVTWNSWVEIHPETADKLGIHDDDIVRVSTPYGFVDAIVYRYPAIRPDTIAIPFGQGHTALGRWAEGRGCNPAHLLPTTVNEAGDLVLGPVLATITPTGSRRPLARVESKAGVYGEH